MLGGSAAGQSFRLLLELQCWPELHRWPKLKIRMRARAFDCFAGSRTWGLPCPITLSVLLQPHLQEIMKVYLSERKYAAKSGGKPGSLPYFHSWLPSDNL